MYPFERFSEDAKAVLTLAQREAEQAQHSYIGTEHLVIALARHGLAAKALVSLGLDPDTLRQEVQTVLQKGAGNIVQGIIPTSRVKRVIEMAFEEARSQQSSYVGTNHMLLALLAEGEGIGAKVLHERGLTVSKARAEFDRLQASGITEQKGTPSAPRQRTQRHLEIPDAKGRVIELNVAFPDEYSEQECQAIVDRIQAALGRVE
jgi:ATP-dependent Clp protease ATP-binding subunit ClpC